MTLTLLPWYTYFFKSTSELSPLGQFSNQHATKIHHIWFIGCRFIVFNAAFNNISVISWRSVVLVVETGVPGANHLPVASH
jgi:carbonic anhydrase/acetyltransferase-like protein (isoleucine patch superfamily)